MDIKREGLLITFANLDGDVYENVMKEIKAFRLMEQAENRIFINGWKQERSYLIDIFFDVEMDIHRMEEYLNARGIVVRLKPKPITVS